MHSDLPFAHTTHLSQLLVSQSFIGWVHKVSYIQTPLQIPQCDQAPRKSALNGRQFGFPYGSKKSETFHSRWWKHIGTQEDHTTRYVTDRIAVEHSMKLMMSDAGASMLQDVTICHHLETTNDDEFIESERRRARDLVKYTIFNIFRTSKPQHQNLTPAEHAEVRSPTDINLLPVSKEKLC